MGRADGYWDNNAGSSAGRWAPPIVFPAPRFECETCGESFETSRFLDDHRFEGHRFSSPFLRLHGGNCARGKFIICVPTEPLDWEVVNCKAVEIDGKKLDAGVLGRKLSTLRKTVVKIILYGDVSIETYVVEFAIADPVEIEEVDSQLEQHIEMGMLSSTTINNFIVATKPFASARRYSDGIATYLYGVLAKDSPLSSVIGADEYRARYTESAELLGSYSTPVSRAICSRIALHFNQFVEALAQAETRDVASAARHFVVTLRLERKFHDRKKGRAPIQDFLFGDIDLDRVIEWACIPVGRATDDEISSMELALATLVPADRIKVLVLVAEHLATSGRVERGLEHAKRISANPMTVDWYRDFAKAFQN